MSFGKIYGSTGHGRTIPSIVAAKANGLDIEVVETKASKTPEYLEIHPLGKIPAFVGANGFKLHEAMAIAIYITSQNEKTTLLGTTKQDYASILRWMSFANTDLITRLCSWYLPLLGSIPYNKKTVEENVAATNAAMKVLETHLTANTFLVGERITLADIFVAAIIRRGYATVLDKKWRSEFVSVTRWFNTVINQGYWKESVPESTFVEEAIKYTPPKKEEKPKKEAAPKPAAAAKEMMRKSQMSSRQYSNNDTRPVAMPWFWEHYKPEEYSLWLVDYKYNDELKLTFMANNLIGGFFARLEASRKYLFGAASVYGENYKCLIRGAFLVRGQEHIPAFDVAPDWESYEFKKLDHTKEEDRKLVEDLWAWDTPVVRDGKEYPHVDGHVFK
ncbi:translation elongation factor eEF-1 subunit gamma, putative [Talaromyces stipitatus ATCC 10500]|uniref:Translation elongation factor eEF-1 subunit gamma, putative n=1 Tax=Talaromyces stipitatus (strain ATCC 10500 / CBS 375.48 / QM 6759 / NRRL 1006) TaxID=441959 RepID=B8MSM9_TALSN|nr:elongation factor 1 gamma domain-containing protein [Talaromyces stipitatus ATCC 10500]EED12466.1 translation elongation factor eEF-1 subunit gamma, putative [Talaromyces stipitatus ATCC 10500]